MFATTLEYMMDQVLPRPVYSNLKLMPGFDDISSL
jgi:hypothetical protein